MSEPQAPVVASNALLASKSDSVLVFSMNSNTSVVRCAFCGAVASNIILTPCCDAKRRCMEHQANPTGQGMTHETGKDD